MQNPQTHLISALNSHTSDSGPAQSLNASQSNSNNLTSMSKRVCIVGGHGYVGSVVTLNMINQGHVVTVVDRGQPVTELCTQVSGDNYTHIQCSLGQLAEKGVDIAEFDFIIYLGGITKPSAGKSVEYAGDAISEFGRLVDGLKTEQCLIYTSSAGVYGNTNGKLAKESEPLPEPINVYDYTKRCMDLVTEMYAGKKKKIFALRLASVCGHSPKFWKSPILNAMISDAINEKQVTVANATKNRGILGFNDFCRALNVVMEKGRLEDSGVFNIGSFNATVGELAQMVVDRYQCNLKVNDGADRSPYDFRLDTTKFEQVFDFTFSDNLESIGLSLEPLWSKATEN